ncbi:response regulator transcription factor [Trinickia mobilis]|uniref:response regulator transcription factor n=1 Tax=Trinickia mobilis TaxID=2816356 RepID=UPI001F5D322D|nr:response regulator transcription factor [Trinickia mobilis]
MNGNRTPIRVAILDDHAVVRLGIQAHLAEQHDIAVVASFAHSRELLDWLPKNRVDVLVLDYSLGPDEIDGLNLIQMIRSRFADCRILVSSAFNAPMTVALTARAGARGFFGKDESLRDLVRAIRKVHAGGTYFNSLLGTDAAPLSPRRASRPEAPAGACIGHGDASGDASGAPPSAKLLLSPREYEVLRCCLAGMTISDIASKFSRSPKTISAQKHAAFRKLGIRSDYELYGVSEEIKAT